MASEGFVDPSPSVRLRARALREGRGWSCRVLAERLTAAGWSTGRSSYATWELGQAKTTPVGLAAALAHVFDVPLVQLLGGGAEDGGVSTGADWQTRVAADLLTGDEQAAIRMAGMLATRLEAIVGEGRTREADLADLTGHVHAVQRAVMAQAAARAYPGKLRLLGGTVEEPALDGIVEEQG